MTLDKTGESFNYAASQVMFLSSKPYLLKKRRYKRIFIIKRIFEL